MAAVACGMVAIGTCNVDVTSSILQAMMEQSETQVKDTFTRFLALGLGLTFLGKLSFHLSDNFVICSPDFLLTPHSFSLTAAVFGLNTILATLSLDLPQLI